MLMEIADKVRLAGYDFEAGKITEEEHFSIMQEVMWEQARCQKMLRYDLQGDYQMYRFEDVSKQADEKVKKNQGGYLMSQEDMDKYDQTRYMVSESKEWYCHDIGDDVYWLYNGEWGAYVQGDDTEILYVGKGDPDNSHVKVDDWKQVSGSWMAKECGTYFYRPAPTPECWDDDIAF